MVPAPSIITCRQWKARPPKTPPLIVGKPDKLLFHHTDGHAAQEYPTVEATVSDAVAYARTIQHQHMYVNGWNDSGHSFLVMRSGLVLQGRWGTIAAIEHGRMVMSAHCPGQNGNPGIEHEHLPGELMTKEQKESSVALMAWICDRCGIPPTNIYGHGVFYPTECPSNLTSDILGMRLLVASKLNYYHPRSKPKVRMLSGKRALRLESKG